jgi:hypothetical protein
MSLFDKIKKQATEVTKSDVLKKEDAKKENDEIAQPTTQRLENHPMHTPV